MPHLILKSLLNYLDKQFSDIQLIIRATTKKLQPYLPLLDTGLQPYIVKLLYFFSNSSFLLPFLKLTKKQTPTLRPIFSILKKF